MDNLRIGRIARALRQRLGLRQQDVGARAGCSQGEVSLLERGRIEQMPVGRLRRLLGVFDAELVIMVRWRGGDLDRLVDTRHASLAEVVSGIFEAAGWIVIPEVSYSIYGERGSIDLLAWHPGTRTLAVVELKTELTSIEETLRLHDVKTRLGPQIARDRFGWNPVATARLLVLPNDRTARRHVQRHRSLFSLSYPLRNVALRRWLRNPSGAVGGLYFVSHTNLIRTRRRLRNPGPRTRGRSSVAAHHSMTATNVVRK